MIADRGNNRIIVVNNRKQVLWRYPSKAHPAPPGGFYFPDDAFFTHDGTQIISNEEENERIVQLSFPSSKILWSYHPETGQGRLNHPSLAERLPGGDIAANDDYRHRVVIIDPKTKKIVWQYGNPGRGPDHLRIPDGFDLLEAGGKIPTHPYTGRALIPRSGGGSRGLPPGVA